MEVGTSPCKRLTLGFMFCFPKKSLGLWLAQIWMQANGLSMGTSQVVRAPFAIGIKKPVKEATKQLQVGNLESVLL